MADNLADTKTYEELAALEREFDDVDTAIIAKKYLLSQPLYAKRAAITSKIPNFWPLVFEQSPTEIDQFIQPSDSEVLATCLKDFSVDRFEIPKDADPNSGSLDSYGTPKSLRFRFEFTENDWFEDTVIEKSFWHRRMKDGEVYLVSEPVRIRWKNGKDLTEGALDAAVRLQEAVMKAGKGAQLEKLKEFQEVKKMMQSSTEGTQSFFAWFGYRGRYVTKEESDEAEAALRRGEKLGIEKVQPDDDEMVDDSLDEIESEIFPAGEDFAVCLAEELWPEALSLFTQSQEPDDDMDMDELDESDDDLDQEDEVPDIRSLVKDSQVKGAPPAKKRKT